jgi:hypothetical protein
MDFFNSLLNNPQGVTFTMLFIGLFVYTIKTNETREKNYRQTIDTLTDQLLKCHEGKPNE